MKRPVPPFDLDALAQIIRVRARSDDPMSYTRRLTEKGTGAIAKKIGEEGVELALAARDGERDAIIHESADLMYHMLVLFNLCGVSHGDVLAELSRRTGQSGIAEKMSRAASPPRKETSGADDVPGKAKNRSHAKGGRAGEGSG